MTTRKLRLISAMSFGLLLIALLIWWTLGNLDAHKEMVFNGQRAYRDVIRQVTLGPRTPGSEAHSQVIRWLHTELSNAGWQIEIQALEMMGHPIQNVIAQRSAAKPQIILGAHYDSRLVADQDPGHGRSPPVPGANDGASGVAVLAELARTLPIDSVPIWLVFFDAEDDANLPGWSGELGSQAFVTTLSERPKAVIIVDMVGDADLNIYIEQNSDPTLVKSIWTQAAKLGYGNQFINQSKYSMIDDHAPFLKAGIPAVDIIDFDYPYWHTAADTADKVSANSLQVVGETLLAWIISQQDHP